MLSEKDQGPLCSSCNIVQITLVSMSDNGRGARVCVDCKRKIKAGIEIVKFNRNQINYAELEKRNEAGQKALYESRMAELGVYKKPEVSQ